MGASRNSAFVFVIVFQARPGAPRRSVEIAAVSLIPRLSLDAGLHDVFLVLSSRGFQIRRSVARDLFALSLSCVNLVIPDREHGGSCARVSELSQMVVTVSTTLTQSRVLAGTSRLRPGSFVGQVGT